MILAIRTDQPEAYIAVLQGQSLQKEKTWPAGRQLADQLLEEIKGLVEGQWSKLTGVVVFTGPGSFTGLRIGITVANTISYSQKIPIVGSGDEDWVKEGAAKLESGEDQKVVLPEYGAEPNITPPK